MKKFIVPILVWGVLTTGIIGWASITHAASSTSAKTGTGTNTNSSATASTNQTIVDKLVQKFNLKKSDVQAVFDDYRQERQKARENQLNANLNKAVQDGVITQDQENKLIQKQKEMTTQKQKETQEMQQFMKDNGIDQSKLRHYVGGSGHRGHGHWRDMGTTQTTTK